jgi:hypothetical protein
MLFLFREQLKAKEEERLEIEEKYSSLQVSLPFNSTFFSLQMSNKLICSVLVLFNKSIAFRKRQRARRES